MYIKCNKSKEAISFRVEEHGRGLRKGSWEGLEGGKGGIEMIYYNYKYFKHK